LKSVFERKYPFRRWPDSREARCSLSQVHNHNTRSRELYFVILILGREGEGEGEGEERSTRYVQTLFATASWIAFCFFCLSSAAGSLSAGVGVLGEGCCGCGEGCGEA
jgi:hypothetical protein